MCDFVSFIILKDESLPNRDRILSDYLLNSHVGAETQNNVSTDSYVEGEWTSEDEGETLIVRTNGERAESWYTSLVLSEFPTRKDLIDWFAKKWGVKYDDSGIKSFGNLTHIGRSLYLEGNKTIKSFGNLTHIGGYLNLRGNKTITREFAEKSRVIIEGKIID